MTLKNGDKVRFREDMTDKIEYQGISTEDIGGIWEVVNTKTGYSDTPIQVENEDDYWCTSEDCLELVDGTPPTQKACEEILDEYLPGLRSWCGGGDSRTDLQQLFIDKGLMAAPKKKKKMIRIEFEQSTGNFKKEYEVDDFLTPSDRFYTSSSPITLDLSGTFTLTEFEVEED